VVLFTVIHETMNLIADIGNSRTKVYLFAGGEIIEKKVFPTLSRALLEGMTKDHSGVRNAILVATGKVPAGVREYLAGLPGLFLQIGPDTPLPVTNLYHTKETLGYDRIAGVVEAHGRFPGENVLVLDAGTALTCDLVTADGAFVGGNISPGLQMRFRALASFTDKLPLVSPEGDLPQVGKTTEEAIRAGVVGGMTAEMDGIIESFREQWNPLQTILTGGDAFFFDKKLKNSIFVLPDLTAHGLNRILEFNVH